MQYGDRITTCRKHSVIPALNCRVQQPVLDPAPIDENRLQSPGAAVLVGRRYVAADGGKGALPVYGNHLFGNLSTVDGANGGE